MKFLSDLTQRSRSWQLLALSALILELSALYFQYGMGLAPCIMCIYQRVAIWSIFLAGVVGSVGCRFIVTRLIAYILWATGSIWGLIIAIEHVHIQAEPFSLFARCDFVPNFPSWAPLHQWIPALFEATGSCGKINWEFMGFSMPQCMVLIFGLYLSVLFFIIVARLLQKKMI